MSNENDSIIDIAKNALKVEARALIQLSEKMLAE